MPNLERFNHVPSARKVSNTFNGTQTDSTDAPACLLTAFNVNAEALFDYPFTAWTINALNTARIASLSLERLHMSIESWARVLPFLVLPVLSKFTMRDTNMTFADLSTFLARRPSITTLDLSGYTPIHPSPLVTAILPRLSILSASHELLICLLGHGNTFPDLASITMSMPSRLLENFDHNLHKIALTTIVLRN
jgi:hypothetical protein